MTTNFTYAPAYHDLGLPEPQTRPDLFEGVLWRRTLAYLIDACCIGAIILALCIPCLLLTVLSFGLLGPGLWFLLGLVPLGYHALLVSGRHNATLGMRAFGLQLYSWDGTPPVFLQAVAHTLLFYLSAGATGFLILLFAVFNPRRCTLHDVLAGVLMLRRVERAPSRL